VAMDTSPIPEEAKLPWRRCCRQRYRTRILRLLEYTDLAKRKWFRGSELLDCCEIPKKGESPVERRAQYQELLRKAIWRGFFGGVAGDFGGGADTRIRHISTSPLANRWLPRTAADALFFKAAWTEDFLFSRVDSFTWLKELGINVPRSWGPAEAHTEKTPNSSKGKRGRVATFDRADAEAFLRQQLDSRGDYYEPNQTDDWNCQRCAVDALRDYLWQRAGRAPKETVLKEFVRRIHDDWKAEKAKAGAISSR